ncbi:IQ-DOMAIN 5-RELATED [Salix koriyanagi]|uniref:IQ-DOMAIN 5-RELATED n=1 Tax=Salix koriyanagi TaxID=2511006 RepID=A0A9Q0WDF7_9ROSI|nr:IQ-DOMAIN 5-RELATED [Salix koriyanagi]
MGDRHGLWAEEHVGSKQSPSALLPRSTTHATLKFQRGTRYHPARSECFENEEAVSLLDTSPEVTAPMQSIRGNYSEWLASGEPSLILSSVSILAEQTGAMGRKSPAKWIKTVLFGKKSSKSLTVKRREKTVNEKETLVSDRALEADLNSVPPVVTWTAPTTTNITERMLEPESRETTELSHDGGILSAENQDANHSQLYTPDIPPSDAEKIRLDEAATIAQAAFRGFMARRAFQALKGIIRLQALIRGHLVRRQAVATLCCVLGVVKLQAVARGRMVRNSEIGYEVHKICSLVKLPEGKLAHSSGVGIQMAKLSSNAFVRKLLAPSPTVMPLQLPYDSMEPNSVAHWLECWSVSCFWKPVPQPKKFNYSKTQRKQSNGQIVEAEAGRPKRSVRRVPAANVDSTSVQAASEFEKPKRNVRRVSSHPADSAENSQIELEKVKRNLRKVNNPVIENSACSEVEIEKPKQGLEKASISSGDNVLGWSASNSAVKMKKEATLTTSNVSDAVKNNPNLMSKLPDAETADEPVEMIKAMESSQDDQAEASVDTGGIVENMQTNGHPKHQDDPTINENHKTAKKPSFTLKPERVENGLQSSPSLPSYMAATESAKAKLRMQGSPRFNQDRVEINNITRRHSLPSSTNSKISSESPRTQRAVHGSGKGGNKSDKSLLSSRDGNANKGAQPEWRR